jgi:quercetin dioxygenase-like cupin family protein
MATRHSSALKAYKRSPGLSNSTWYKGILVSQMAGTLDNAGAFDLIISKIKRGTEPPPHVHSREHELFYLFSGEMQVYVGEEVFTVTAGECVFLPRGIPHGFLISTEEVHNLTLITPGGFLDAVNRMNAPAERMEVPTDADSPTYASSDLTETFRIFERYGIRFLTEGEIRTELPQYPAPND